MLSRQRHAGCPPPLGRCTDDVLRSLGYDAALIAELRERGIVK